MTTKKNNFYDYFIATSRNEFAFLEETFFINYSETITGDSVSIIYKNDKVCIAITLDERHGGIIIDLIRLKDKQIPSLPTEINNDTELNEFDLEDLLYLRNPILRIEKPSLDDLVFKPGREKVIKKILNQYADALRTYAPDVLRGDFAIFDRLEKIVKERADDFKKKKAR